MMRPTARHSWHLDRKADVMHSTLVFPFAPRRLRRAARLAWLPLVVMTAASACTNKADTAPGTGPSELGLSLGVTASPDVLELDGLSQSTITITARGPDGGPMNNVGVNLDIRTGDQIQDLGRLSSKNVRTGSDGVARVTYTAPFAPASGNSDTMPVVTIQAIPEGNDYSNAVSRSVDIRLRSRGIILPVAFAPIPRVTFSPTDPGTDQDIRFDASSSIASCAPDPAAPNDASRCTPVAGATIVSYLWDFGNGRSGTGVRSSSFYSTAGTYTVKLTVTNDRGLSNTGFFEVTITAVAGPTAAFTASPLTVGVGERVNVDASASTPTHDRDLIEFNWSWGDGRTSSGKLQSHTYSQAGSYTITLTVVDSTGRTGTATQQVQVGAGQLPTANFNFSPTTPRVSDTVNFDATVSSAPPGRTIVRHEWNWGDGSAVLVGNEPRPSHRYGQPGTYVVTLTVIDSATARSLAVTKNVTVTP